MLYTRHCWTFKVLLADIRRSGYRVGPAYTVLDAPITSLGWVQSHPPEEGSVLGPQHRLQAPGCPRSPGRTLARTPPESHLPLRNNPSSMLDNAGKRRWELGWTSELSFLEEPSNVIAVRGRPLVLHCRVEGEEPISISWRRGGRPLSPSPRRSLLANGSLLITSFLSRENESDSGEYDCTAQNRFGLLLSRRARVQVATLSRFLTHPQSMRVQLGGVARFQCQINGVPRATITWELNRVPLNMDDNRFTLLPSGVLQITGVGQQDLGDYRCVAANAANSRASQEARLTLAGWSPRTDQEPEILSGPQDLTLTVHQTAILECIATGNPRPIVSWSRLDGRSIGVDGIEVLGTGNLKISDVTVHHSGVYVCAANKPGTRVRRTAQGRLVVQAPPEFVQWPQSVSKRVGSTAVFTCVAQGVPEPQLVWLKNGRVLAAPSDNIKLTHSNSTLIINRVTGSDEAIYQCIARNSAGTNQASARLAVTLSQELPAAPEGVRAEPVSPTAIRLSWREPSHSVTEEIIGYVLHIRPASEPAGKELQEAVGRTTLEHIFTNLQPDTEYSMYVKAYSPVGASGQSQLVTASTGGEVPDVMFFAQVLNGTAVQVFWEPSPRPRLVRGYKLYLRKLPSSRILGPTLLPSSANTHTFTQLEPSALYEIKMQAFNQHGDGNSTVRFVSLGESTESPGTFTLQDPGCDCQKPQEASLSGIVVGIHIGIACIIFCILFLMLGYRRRLLGCRGIKESWSVPQPWHSTAQEGQNGHLGLEGKDGRELELTELKGNPERTGSPAQLQQRP
ncbi:immunoglobulin superfamily DCC subclass member 3-like [Pristis pectinata]|uniref:immunoglobulin superfamily DCC subclass member 3-like n=1 Tax=Pristis pectinata TaxID=685728 RepID=UPI00223DCD7D|nr:immunoglobulin superfamily DCC subclass member 3-like [Pristis pectinata]